jgi:hypothetical protein
MNLKPKFWNADKIVSFSAILISLATMGVYIYQTHLIQKQQNASIMPYLRMGYSFDEDRFEFMLFNEGLGPAFIEEVNTYYNGKKYSKKDVPDFFQTEYQKVDSTLNMSYSNVSQGMLFAAGSEIIIISQRKSLKNTEKLKKIFFNKKIEMEVIFTSVYGEKWITRGAFTRPKKIED